MHTAPPPSESASPLPENAQQSGPKLWHVGTLVYTTAGLVALFMWLLWGDFAWSMKDRSVGPVVQFLVKKYKATDLVMVLLLSTIPTVMGLFMGPIISYKSDRLRSRWGRRIPFIILTTPFTSLTMFGLAAGPWLAEKLHGALGPSSPGLNTCFLIIFGICWVLFEFATITANSVFGALINDVVPQPVLGRFYGLFRMFSLIAAIVFNKLIIGHTEEYYAWIFIGMGLLYGVGVTLMCFMVKEGQYPPPPQAEDFHGRKQGFLAAAKTYFKECFTHPYYLWYFAGFTMIGMGLSPVNMFQQPYAQSLNMDLKAFGDVLGNTYLISLVLAYPLGALADRMHALRLTMIAAGLYAITALWGGFFARDAANFKIALFAHTLISGIYWTASASVGQKLLPRSRFAELSSAGGIIGSICGIIFPLALGEFLDLMRGGDPNKPVYHNTFLVGGVFMVIGLSMLFVLHSKFMAAGGPKNYVPPDFGREFKR
jgi:maltose/moltooligosaccharide transporter